MRGDRDEGMWEARDRSGSSDPAVFLLAEFGQPGRAPRPRRGHRLTRGTYQRPVSVLNREEGYRWKIAVEAGELFLAFGVDDDDGRQARGDPRKAPDPVDHAGQVVHGQFRLRQDGVADPNLTVVVLPHQGVKLGHQNRHETAEDQQQKAGGKLHRVILGTPPGGTIVPGQVAP